MQSGTAAFGLWWCIGRRCSAFIQLALLLNFNAIRIRRIAGQRSQCAVKGVGAKSLEILCLCVWMALNSSSRCRDFTAVFTFDFCFCHSIRRTFLVLGRISERRPFGEISQTAACGARCICPSAFHIFYTSFTGNLAINRCSTQTK